MQKRTHRRVDAWIVVAIVHVGIALLLVSSTGGCGSSTREANDTPMAPVEDDVKVEDLDTAYEVDDAPVIVSDHDDTPISTVRDTTPVTPRHDVRYVVQAGDSLWRISRKFGVSVEAIADRNDIRDTSLIREGRELWIPNPTKSVEDTPTETATHTTTTVTDTTVTDPIVTDPTTTDTTTDTMLIDTTTDTTTDTTVIETTTGEITTSTDTTPIEPATAQTIKYVVQPGDTIWKLARQYHTTTKTIMELNGITDATKMRAGDTILIPKPLSE